MKGLSEAREGTALLRLGQVVAETASRLGDAAPRRSAGPMDPEVHVTDASPLFKLQAACNRLLNSGPEPHAHLVAFVLSSLVTDMARNLFVDTRFSFGLARVRTQVLQQMQSDLTQLATAIEDDNWPMCVELLTNLVQCYTSAVGELRALEVPQYA